MRPGFDRRLFVALRTKGHSRPLEVMLTALSQSGNWGLIWLALAVVFFAAGTDNGRAGLVFMPVTVYLTLAVNYGIKVALKRERPIASEPELRPLVGVPSSKSFPSSHAAMSFAAAVVFTYFHTALWPLFFGLALVISWTRVYVGVHYPSDVIAGTMVGLIMGTGLAMLLGSI
jgi:undecaprenyl-diphosphatase